MPPPLSAAQAANALPLLAPAALPYEHLSLLSKRLGSLIRSILDMQAALQADFGLEDW
jgi:hypothetical protein